MKKPKPVLYPLLFALYPVLTFYANNMHELPFVQTVRSLVLFPFLALVLMAVLWWIVRDWRRAGFLTLLGVLFLLYYGVVYYAVWKVRIAGFRVFNHGVLVLIWLVLLFVIGRNKTWQHIRNPDIVATFLNIVAAVAVLFSVMRIMLPLFTSVEDTQPPSQSMPAQEVHLNAGPRPDVYYIIVDGYARADVLQELYDFDNSDFIHALERRGFYVASESRANYMQTTLSLASSLNFTYLDAPEMSQDRGILGDMIAHSQVRALLEASGYTSISFSSGYIHTDIRDADIYYSPYANTAALNEFEGLLMSSSIAVIFMDLGLLENPIAGYKAHRDRVLYTFGHLPALAEMGGAKFVFAHVIAPHPPFVLDREGRPIQADRPYSLFDADAFSGALDEYLTGYIDELIYVNQRLLEIVDEILAQSERPPVIIIQGDHGPGAYLSWHSVEESCLKERFAILNAYYFPDQDTASYLYPSITPVNTFRILFDVYFDTELGLLEDHVYYSTWAYPYNFQDVTERSQEACGVDGR